MNTLLIISLGVAIVIALLLLIALFKKRNYDVHRKIIIDAPKQKVFDYLKLLKNQDTFNKWVTADPDKKTEFKGTDGTVGFIYGWNGNKKAGEGEQEIKEIVEGEKVGTEIRFVRPFKAIAHADFVTKAITDNQTKVIWKNTSTLKYPMNIMVGTIEKMLAKDMDTSLSNLKRVLEKE